MSTSRASIPVTTIGGYLGAGKTTLLNCILRNANGLRVAVLVNDFGSISIDEKLIVGRDGHVVTLANGCACCSIAGDLAEALDRMTRLSIRPQHILTETSGVARPSRVAELSRSPGLERGRTVVVADVASVRKQAGDKFVGRLVQDQLAQADVIILNKVDLVDAGQLEVALAWMKRVAPRLPIVEAVQADVPFSAVFGAASRGSSRLLCDDAIDDAAFQSFCWTAGGLVDLLALRKVIEALPLSVVRAKGVIANARDAVGPQVLHLAGERLNVAPLASAVSRTEIVFVAVDGGLDPEALGTALDRCVIGTGGHP